MVRRHVQADFIEAVRAAELFKGVARVLGRALGVKPVEDKSEGSKRPPAEITQSVA